MLSLLVFINSLSAPKIEFKQIYIINPIVIVVKDKEDLACNCDEFVLEDEPDLMWDEL